MERMLYLVAPVADQLDWDEDGPVNNDLFVWAKNASEAVQLWRAHYGMDDDEDCKLGLGEPVRVFEAPIMPAAATSIVLGWGDIIEYSATILDREEVLR